MKNISFWLILFLLLSACSQKTNLESPDSDPAASVYPGSQTHENIETWEIVKERLEGLSFADFMESSYREILIRTPELVTEIGLDRTYVLEGNQLNNCSNQYLEETRRIRRGILSMLKNYPEDALSKDMRIYKDVIQWYLTDLSRLGDFSDNRFMVSHFIISEPGATELFFTEIQPMNSRADAENFITRLEQVGLKLYQLAEGILLRQAKGIILPRLSIDWTLRSIAKTTTAYPEKTLYYAAFKEKLEELELGEEKRQELLERARIACETSVIPGYLHLEEVLSGQKPLSSGNNGAWSLPDGEKYYRKTLAHFTTTDFSPEEIHERGYRELERIHGQMRSIMGGLEIDTTLTIAEMYGRLDRRTETVPGYRIVEVYSNLIDQAEIWIKPFFTRFPMADVIVKGADAGGFYVPSPVDGSRPGMFFATRSQEELYKMPTLTFHETIPGHHFQIALAYESNISPYQKGGSFLGYTEGWALYAERLMAETGFYDSYPQGDLGRLQAEAFRAARLVIDTGLHEYRWSLEQAVKFFVENTGFPEGFAWWECLRYLVWPGQSTAYMTGLLHILDLREDYKAAYGENFDIRDFHSLILDQGAMPLTLLTERIANN